MTIRLLDLISIDGLGDNRCRFCGAFYWKEELNSRKLYTKCCGQNGRIRLPFLHKPNDLMQELLTMQTNDAILFQGQIRKFNTCVAFASTLFKQREQISNGPPVIIVEGNIQHKIGSIFSDPSRVASFMQTYFHQDGESAQNEYFRLSTEEVFLMNSKNRNKYNA